MTSILKRERRGRFESQTRREGHVVTRQRPKGRRGLPAATGHWRGAGQPPAGTSTEHLCLHFRTCQQSHPFPELGPGAARWALTSISRWGLTCGRQLTSSPSPEAELGAASPQGASIDQESDLSLFGAQKTREQNLHLHFVKLANNSDLSSSFLCLEFDVNKM